MQPIIKMTETNQALLVSYLNLILLKYNLKGRASAMGVDSQLINQVLLFRAESQNYVVQSSVKV